MFLFLLDHTAGFFFSFHIYELKYEFEIYDLKKKWLSRCLAQVAVEFSGVPSLYEWAPKAITILFSPLHNDFEFIKSFSMVPAHKSLNSSVNSH